MGVRRVTLLQIMDTLGFSYSTVNRSLHIELKVTKCAGRWVLRMLLAVKRQMRIYISAANLKRLPEDNENFISCLVTHDKTWI